MTAVKAPPSFLAATLHTMSFYRRAGEWDLEPPAAMMRRPSPDIVALFLQCFPWASVTSLEVGGGVPDYGFEAVLALRLKWTSPRGLRGESEFPNAGKLWFDRDSALLCFTVWPNFFTDLVPFYRFREGGSEVELGELVNAAASSAANRRSVANALAAWRTVAGGLVTCAESELVEGVTVDGFRDDAVSFES